jgi:hypothetical protein
VTSSPNLARARAKIEQLPTDDGSVLDTLAGAILRLFVRVQQIEAMNERLMHKLAALEAADGKTGHNSGPVSTLARPGDGATPAIAPGPDPQGSNAPATARIRRAVHPGGFSRS